MLSIVIPCLNEEAVLPELHRRLTPICRQVADENFEIILIDDGSTDKTSEMMGLMAKENDNYVCVRLSRNFGHQLALSAGLSVAKGSRVLVLDADLQDPPELLPKMMGVMDQGHDVVYGKRRKRHGETAFKRVTARWFYKVISRLVDFEIPSDTGDFRLMSRQVVDIFNEMPEYQRFVRGMISWIGLSQVAIEYDRDPRFAGETKYPLRKMITFSIDAITSFSIIPLRIGTLLGCAVSMLSFCVLIYTLVVWLLGLAVPGWSSLMVAMLLLGGVQLLTIGILGEYVGRIYIQTKGRPKYLVQSITRSDAQAPLDANEQQWDKAKIAPNVL
jgi:glycosyltransferase involved in cell wall biosynthesis